MEEIKARRISLSPAVVEYNTLGEMLELIDKVKSEQLTGTYDQVKEWVKSAYGATDVVRPRDARDHFNRADNTWAHRTFQRLVEDGALEKYGRGLYRVPPVRTGEVRLRIAS